MNKNILFLGFISLLVACGSEDVVDARHTTTDEPKLFSGNTRSYNEAFEIAQKSIAMVETSNVTRSSVQRRIDPDNSFVFSSKGMTRLANEASDTLLYVFNFENEEGFALVSASRNTEGLLAITESGSYRPDVPSEIEGLNMYKQSIWC